MEKEGKGEKLMKRNTGKEDKKKERRKEERRKE